MAVNFGQCTVAVAVGHKSSATAVELRPLVQHCTYLTQDKPFTTTRSLEWKTKGQQKNRNPPLQAQMQFITQRTLNHSC